jgi:hypothetical protein
MEGYRVPIRLEFDSSSTRVRGGGGGSRVQRTGTPVTQRDKSRKATARALPRKREYAQRADMRRPVRKAA